MDVRQTNLRELESVKHFVACGDAFCTLLENSAPLAPYEFLRQTATALAHFYGAALALPEVECSDSLVTDKTQSSERKLLSQDVVDGLRKKLDDFECYWEVLNPYEEDVPVQGSILDDVGDIYRDYGRYLERFRSGSDADVCEAIWHWKFGFGIHWGDHIVDSLRAIHRLIANPDYGFRPKDIDDDYDEEETRAE
jgi:Domain of unknown function (DUF5063)